MGKVVIDMSMSLDGYIAAPNDRPGQGLGEDGMRLHNRIGLTGANLDQQYLAAGLVDEIRIHLVNVLLGGGRRLFDVLPHRIELEQTSVYDTPGVAHLEYRVVR